MYKVYRHKTETDGRVFYVGCGNKYRPHKTSGRTKEWNDIYENEGLVVDIVLEIENKDEALELESLLIQEYKRICDGGTLVNKSIFDHSKGKIVSDETKQKISKSRNIPILQYTKEGTFIKEWKSATIAANNLNIQQTHISSCCKCKRKTAGGFIWKYKEEKES